MTIKAFGNSKGKNMRLKEYQVVRKPENKSSSIYVKALAIPSICAPISRQNLRSAVEQNDFLGNLNLADNGDNNDREIDVLIGADVYWKVVSGNIKKDENSGLTAISSFFGWLINGPVTEKQEKSVHVVKSVMSVQYAENEDSTLDEKIGKFWELDLIGINDEIEKDEKAKDDVIGKILFEKGRYKVELPFHNC